MNDFCIVKLEPGQAPEFTYIEDTLQTMLDLLGGSMEATFPWEDVALLGNELSKVFPMPPNFVLINQRTGKAIDVICGPCFICGVGEEDFASLSPELAEKYLEIFENADLYNLFGMMLPAIPV